MEHGGSKREEGPVPGAERGREDSTGGDAARRIGLFAGPALLAAVLGVGPFGGLGGHALLTAGVAGWMATWWMTEAVPLPVTSLLPLVLFPLLGLGTIGEAASPFANPVIFLFLGGFLIASAMEECGLPRRVALRTILLAGTGPRAIVAGFMAASAALSMWVSNTATAVMMLPIAVSVLDLLEAEGAPVTGTGRRAGDEDRSNLGVCLMLGIAYACSIGGLGTLIGTPPNAFLAGFLSEAYGRTIGFAQWMLFGVPLVLVGLPVAYLLLTRVLYPIGGAAVGDRDRSPGGASAIRQRLRELGPMASAERRVLAVFAVTALAWVTRPLLERLLPGLDDASIAVAGAVALFLVPRGGEGSERLLDWEGAARIPWGVLLLFGGGLSLAAAFERNGLTTWIGRAAGEFVHLPELAVVALVVTTVVFLTELTSNTATAAALLPVFASVAVGTGADPMALALPAAIAATCAFMLPVATPPNAIVFGSGELTIAQMARAGVWLNLAFVALVTLFASGLGGAVFG